MNTNLFGETPESRSIAIIREFEPPEGYWGAFSGGKDSVVLKEVTRRAGVKVEWHYNVTTIDPPEVVKFIGKQHPDVAFDKPAKSFTNFIRANWGLPMRQGRWCCEELKERGGQGRIVLTGVRAEESARRSRYGVVQPCLRGGGKTFVHAILHWTADNVWGYIRGEGLPYCELYDQGWSRVGCVFCPFEKNMRRAEARWPRMFARLRQAVADAYPTQASWQKYGSPEVVMAWWLDRRRPQVDGDEQQVFAFDQFGGEFEAE